MRCFLFFFLTLSFRNPLSILHSAHIPIGTHHMSGVQQPHVPSDDLSGWHRPRLSALMAEIGSHWHYIPRHGTRHPQVLSPALPASSTSFLRSLRTSQLNIPKQNSLQLPAFLMSVNGTTIHQAAKDRKLWVPLGSSLS